MDKNAITLGLQIGRLIAGQRGKKLVGYSYNGVILPKLPEWDKEKYPIAVIFYHGVLKCHVLHCLAENAYFFVRDTTVYFGGVSGGETVKGLEYREEKEQGWSFFIERDNDNVCMSGLAGILNPPFWSNIDLEYDGTTYSKASEPVPVYE